jgi:hypothetical protein
LLVFFTNKRESVKTEHVTLNIGQETSYVCLVDNKIRS